MVSEHVVACKPVDNSQGTVTIRRWVESDQQFASTTNGLWTYTWTTTNNVRAVLPGQSTEDIQTWDLKSMRPATQEERDLFLES